MFLSNTNKSIWLALVFAWSLARTNGACPPENFDAKADVNLPVFIAERWYSIQQKEVFYQPSDEFNCVYAEYELDTTSFCLFCGSTPRISVYNRALNDDGNENSINFRAIFSDKQNTGKGFVAPSFLPLGPISWFGLSNYWIIDAGTDESILGTESSSNESYDWAIITAGSVDKAGSTDGTCVADGGMWLFHRNPTPDSKVVATMQERAAALGLDTTQMLPVKQEGCIY